MSETGEMSVCRYCGGVIRLVPVETVYGASTARLGLAGEKLYQCQNCGARVGCHKGTTRPLGSVANEMLRLKRKETHEGFDAWWRARRMTRTQAYKWLSEQFYSGGQQAHIGSFEMDQCQRLIDLCRSNGMEAA